MTIPSQNTSFYAITKRKQDILAEWAKATVRNEDGAVLFPVTDNEDSTRYGYSIPVGGATLQDFYDYDLISQASFDATTQLNGVYQR